MRVSNGFVSGTDTERPWGVWGGFSSNPLGLNEKLPPKKHSGKLRPYIGNLPETGQWSLVAQNNGWWLLVDLESSGTWKTLKLGSKIYRYGKANFKLAWNGERLAKGDDHALLIDAYPEVEEWVIDKLVVANV